MKNHTILTSGVFLLIGSLSLGQAVESNSNLFLEKSNNSEKLYFKLLAHGNQ